MGHIRLKPAIRALSRSDPARELGEIGITVVLGQSEKVDINCNMHEVGHEERRPPSFMARYLHTARISSLMLCRM